LLLDELCCDLLVRLGDSLKIPFFLDVICDVTLPIAVTVMDVVLLRKLSDVCN
jgi:hypothetical protein